MKIATKFFVLILCAGFLFPFSGFTQVTYQYLLKDDFKGEPSSAPDLVQAANDLGQTGMFVQRTVPASTCGQQGTAPGYFFADNAGLAFNNPAGFIDQAYTIAFNFQFDEFVSPSWVRILGFTWGDDVGIYIYLTNPPTNGTLDFWPYGMVGEENFFNTVDFYQMILVRNETGLIKVYVNGSEFAEYDDSESQAYLPQSPNNYILWFKDDPSVAANEASPGFVSDIRIANFAWTPVRVGEEWSKFCSSLLPVQEQMGLSARVYPNPASDKLIIETQSVNRAEKISILDITGKIVLSMDRSNAHQEVDVRGLCPGIYFLEINDQDSRVFYRFIKK